MGRIRRKFRQKALSEKELHALETAALGYPLVKHDDFKEGFLFTHEGGNDVFRGFTPENIRITPGKEIELPGAERKTPSYTLEITDTQGNLHILKDRVAIAGIGSNSSQKVLARKFHHFQAEEETPLAVCVIPATLENHAVVHGAFVGARGPVPATIHEDQGTVATITIGFYDAKAAGHITGTEPNYDGLLLDTPAILQNGLKINQPLAYVAVWGALQDPQNPDRPLALAAIPAQTSLAFMSNKDALIEAIRISDHVDLAHAPEDIKEKAMRHYIRENFQDEQQRIKRIKALQNHSLPPNIRGKRVFAASFTKNPQVAALLPQGKTPQKQPKR
ncbi:MAG: hypothetical protein EP349_07445 [Alphaproteobacteria bacterium]|nr:MAG: hypothetical protein EP349_07445 [Alphaproteobacteria bacterium]